jgi:hypothetical protein
MKIPESTWTGILCSLGIAADEYNISFKARELMATILIQAVGKSVLRDLDFRDTKKAITTFTERWSKQGKSRLILGHKLLSQVAFKVSLSISILAGMGANMREQKLQKWDSQERLFGLYDDAELWVMVKQANLLFEVLVFCDINAQIWPKHNGRFWKGVPMDYSSTINTGSLMTEIKGIPLAWWAELKLEEKIWENPRLAASIIARGTYDYYRCVPRTIAWFFKEESPSSVRTFSDVIETITRCVEQHDGDYGWKVE